MQLINNSRFPVQYRHKLDSPDPIAGDLGGGSETTIPNPTFTVTGDAHALGSASVENVPSDSIVTFTVEGSLRITVESSD